MERLGAKAKQGPSGSSLSRRGPSLGLGELQLAGRWLGVSLPHHLGAIGLVEGERRATSERAHLSETSRVSR